MNVKELPCLQDLIMPESDKPTRCVPTKMSILPIEYNDTNIVFRYGPLRIEQYLCDPHWEHGRFSFKDKYKFLRDWAHIDFPKGETIRGVYSLGGFYIGRADHIRNRLITHIRQSIMGNHPNKDIQERIREKIRAGQPIICKILSTDPRDEASFIEQAARMKKDLANNCTIYNSNFGKRNGTL